MSTCADSTRSGEVSARFGEFNICAGGFKSSHSDRCRGLHSRSLRGSQRGSESALRGEELIGSANSYRYADFMDRNFNVLLIPRDQPLAITRTILTITDGIVGGLSGAANVSERVWCKLLWKI